LSSLVSPVQVERGFQFDSLPVPLRLAAFDLVTHCRVVHSSGHLAECQLSSMAVPTVFPAVRMGDMLLVDGGVGDNLPVDVAEQTWPYPVLAVDISSGPPEIPENPSLVQVGTLTFEALSARVNNFYSAPPDYLFRPDLHGAKSYTFTSEAADTLIRLGYNQMMEYLNSHPEIPRSSVAGDTVNAPPPLLRIDSIEFRGLETVSREAVNDWLILRPGDRTDPGHLRNAAEKLYASGLFERVDYVLEPSNEEGGANIVYSFIEKEPSSIGIGMTYNDQLGLDGRITYRHNNFLNAGDHLIMNGGGGEYYIFGDLRVLDLSSGRRSWFADYSLTAYQVRMKTFHRDGSSGISMETSGSASAARGFSTGWFGLSEFGVAGELHRYGSGPNQGFGSLFLGHLTDTMDDPVNPRSGMRLSGRLWWSPFKPNQHLGFRWDLTGAVPFLRKGTLSGSLWGQLLTGNTLPWQNRRLSAARSVPGIPCNSLASRQRMAGLLRFRRKLNGPFFLSVEAGGLCDWESVPELSDAELSGGAGVSIGLETAMGPASVSWGYSSIFKSRWSVSVGSAMTYGPGR
ncbi:MAG: hypothetical protein GF388_07750, partial [Candidatus Aegiribacteria sp.]|nr:hypothetical protein [Candidatus Aegiribacteria sp.]MBD3295012.1 hypothetical protein [Candidatus Fermentibacteria bacterium]